MRKVYLLYCYGGSIPQVTIHSLQVSTRKYGHRSYSLIRYRITSAHISWILYLRSASAIFLDSCNSLVFRAFFSCAFFCRNGVTRLRCQALRALVEFPINCSVWSSPWSTCKSSCRSLGVADTVRTIPIWAIRSGCTWLDWSSAQLFATIPEVKLFVSCSDCFPRLGRLSIWIINPCSRPIIAASHQIHCAAKL